ncbi:MAG TPA: cbb3-type cytochrome oxidase assembly protein CcoS [Coriobacteriia bacterium]
MLFGLWVVVGWMALVTLSGLALIAWGLKSHQFDDIEDSKYWMLEDHEPEAWPKRARPEGGAKHA